MMFVVVRSPSSMVATSDFQDAIKTARQDGLPLVYRVMGAMDAPAALAAMRMEEGEPVPVPPTTEEIAARQKREELERLRPKLEEQAALQVARDRFAEHNALVDAGEPGVLKGGGDILAGRREFPDSGPGSRTERKRLAKLVRESQNPIIVERFDKALRALLSRHGLRRK